METKSFEYDLAGRTLRFTPNEYAPQASGSVTVSLGDTMILATATMSDEGREGATFFPLMVDFEEKHYAAGKIKGSRFVKRGGRPSEKAVLTARLTDRPIRPLFPKGITNEVQIICTALSVDLEVEVATTVINAASAALCISGMPFEGPIGAVRIGLNNGELVVNPTMEQLESGDLNLVVAGTKDAITMVEADANDIDDEMMLKALELAHKHIRDICGYQEEMMKEFGKDPLPYTVAEKNEEVVKAVESFITDEMLDSITGVTKKDVKVARKAVEEKALEHFAQQLEDEVFSKGELKDEILYKFEKRMRQNILDKETRLDGRKLDDIRPLTCNVGRLPRTHGSGLFQRGETQILSICTLGSPGDAQVIETMDEAYDKRYFHHYNFPPYSVGEVRPLRGTSRREIGHGMLAERALMRMLPAREEFPYTIWVSSEVLGCNGSSSMASVCGSTLSLMDAGVPLKTPISGIAMGLVTDGEGTYKILTDIQGAEDFAGDMDFKVSGSREGITSLQMDVKVKGLSVDLMREALGKAKTARNTILDAMLAELPASRPELSPRAPMITSITIDPDQIALVIGKGGETIQKITKECDVSIDIEDSGLVMITAPDQEKGKKAQEWIEKITYVPQVGDVFDGKVVRIMDFGAFVEIVPGKDGLVHISQLAHHRVNKVTDVVQMGDTLKVKLMEIDSQGRLNLSHKVLLPKPERGGGDRPAENKRPEDRF